MYTYVVCLPLSHAVYIQSQWNAKVVNVCMSEYSYLHTLHSKKGAGYSQWYESDILGPSYLVPTQQIFAVIVR